MSVEYKFGRVPDELRQTLAKLSGLEARLYLLLTVTAIRKEDDPNVGCVNISKSALAREMGIDPKSVRVAAKGLITQGLLLEGRASCPAGWGVIPHYLGAEPLPPRVSSPTKTPQPKQNTTTYEPLKRSEEVSEDVDVTVAAKLVKKPSQTKPSWIIWNDSEKRLKVRSGEAAEASMKEFVGMWVERLGCDEGLIDEQFDKAERWLQDNPEKRAKTKRFDRFFGKWLGKLLEE